MVLNLVKTVANAGFYYTFQNERYIIRWLKRVTNAPHVVVKVNRDIRQTNVTTGPTVAMIVIVIVCVR
ncbi:hypothetical protein J6590_001277 [Homalodisca vitripennis]|nr:hypothetical protein J6590_001277 [Homalodisca vitripennis]